jgi:hypothetical protein
VTVNGELTDEEPVGNGAPPDCVVSDSSSKAVDNAEDVEAKLLPGLNGNERTWWWPAMMEAESGARQRRMSMSVEEAKRGGALHCAHAPGIRMPWHGAAVTIDGDRRLRALHRERGHRVVTGSVVGGAGPGDWRARLNPLGPLTGGPTRIQYPFKFPIQLEFVNSKGSLPLLQKY